MKGLYKVLFCVLVVTLLLGTVVFAAEEVGEKKGLWKRFKGWFSKSDTSDEKEVECLNYLADKYEIEESESTSGLQAAPGLGGITEQESPKGLSNNGKQLKSNLESLKEVNFEDEKGAQVRGVKETKADVFDLGSLTQTTEYHTAGYDPEADTFEFFGDVLSLEREDGYGLCVVNNGFVDKDRLCREQERGTWYISKLDEELEEKYLEEGKPWARICCNSEESTFITVASRSDESGLTVSYCAENGDTFDTEYWYYGSDGCAYDCSGGKGSATNDCKKNAEAELSDCYTGASSYSVACGAAVNAALEEGRISQSEADDYNSKCTEKTNDKVEDCNESYDDAVGACEKDALWAEEEGNCDLGY
tara:strand:- start:4812 stop:5897 length:1086 start_codon:yes stop_codon:yes gene_type:complete